MYWTISKEVNNEKIAWMAGIWDGEGCLRAATRKNVVNNNPTLFFEAFVKNTDVLMIREISKILHACKIKFCFFLQKSHVDKDRVNHKKIICIKVSGKGNVWKLLTLMFPYLITKKKQASLMLQLIEYRESLGYHGPAKGHGGKKENWNGKKITDDPKIVDLLEKLHKEKSNLIDPSETKRVANKPLEINQKLLEAYLMI